MIDHTFVPDADGGFQVDSCVDCGRSRREHEQPKELLSSNLVAELYAYHRRHQLFSHGEMAYQAACEIDRLTAREAELEKERDEARSIADQAHSLVDSLREERSADLARAYDTGHHHGALGIMEIPAEYRQPVETDAKHGD